MVSKTCPNGKIWRNGYTAKRYGKKIKVKGDCIRATSQTGEKRSLKDKEFLTKREKIHEEVDKEFGNLKCPKGTIERVGFTKNPYKRKSYTRKSGSKVHAAKIGPSLYPPVCIKKRGEPTKGYKIPVHLNKGVLKKYGYNDVKNMSSKERHEALMKAKKDINPLSLYRKLIVVSTMNEHTNPEISKIFKSDANWVKTNFGLLATGPHEVNVRHSRKSRGSKYNKTGGSKKTSKKGSKTSKKTSKKGSKTSKKRKTSKGSKTSKKTKKGSKTSKKTSKKGSKKGSKTSKK